MRGAAPAENPTPRGPAVLSVAVPAAVAVVVGALIAALARSVAVGLVSGWLVFASAFLALTWVRIGRLDAGATAAHATRNDPTARVRRGIVLVAAVASLASTGLLLADAGKHGHVLAAVSAVVSVAASWLLVHTVFTVRYAALYYGGSGGVDFNQRARPAYRDFAYLAFTIGMTYQVSDTDLTSIPIRRTVLAQALLSYLLGAVVVACTVNLIASLA